jgi:S-adenosylmethionine:tRNA ribosyltransferase-isomerase
VEAPSAGFALSGERLAELRRAGVHITALTHAAGLSATGDTALDARLPLGERYHVPEDCAEQVSAAKQAGRRVIAAGTSVVRALESAHIAGAGRVVAGDGYTELRITAAHRLCSVDGLLTGIHDPSASHHALLEAFCSRETLARAHALAEAGGYLEHEFGDFCLVL